MAAQIKYSVLDADLHDTPLRNLIAAGAALLLFTWTPLAMILAMFWLSDMSSMDESMPVAKTAADYALGGAFIAAGLLPLALMIGAYRHPRLLLAAEVAALLGGISMFWLG
jgi:hypothetical protein